MSSLDALLRWSWLGAEVDRQDRRPEWGRMRLVRAESDRGAQHVHENDEEMPRITGALVLAVMDLVRERGDDHVVRTNRARLAEHLVHREPACRVDALRDFGHLLVAPPGAHHLIGLRAECHRHHGGMTDHAQRFGSDATQLVNVLSRERTHPRPGTLGPAW